jgi:hypothetical protein
MFASSPALDCKVSDNPSCDSTQTQNKYQGQPYTGLTLIENYATLGADLGLVVQAGKYARFRLNFDYTTDQSHFITIDDVGRAFDPGKGNGCDVPVSNRVSRPCEFNPAYRPVINEVGRRYKVDSVNVFNLGVWGQVMF